MTQSVRLVTMDDLVSHCLDYVGASVDERNVRNARRAVQSAFREVVSSREWAYYNQIGYITTVASYSTGTIAYDHTGGANERQVTLTTGTWPDWAASGTILISNIPYEVSTRVSGSIITLTAANNPGADVASGTTYTLYQDTYSLPGNFRHCDEMINFSNLAHVRYVDPAQWLEMHRVLRATGLPRVWTVQPSHKYQGILAAKFFPPPDAIYRFDFMYQKRPRNLNVSLYDLGTVSTTDGSTTISGDGSYWTSAMVGAVIRISSSTTDPVTGVEGENPYVIERVITDVASTTSLTVDADPDQTLSDVTYSISDPVDIEAGAMLTYLLRECEKQMRLIKRLQPTPTEEIEHTNAKVVAWAADNRARERMFQGDGVYAPYRLADVPLGSNQP